MHDATKLLLGATKSNHRDVSKYESDPTTYKAGLCVSLDDAGLLTLTPSTIKLGVSLGKALDATAKRTSVLRAGEGVPVLATLKRASGTVTITSYANLVSGTDDALSVAGTAFTAQTGAVTPGDATFQAATGNNETAASLASQINAHATVSLKVYAVASSAVVTLYSVAEGAGSTGTGNDIAVSYTDNDTNVGLTLAGLSGGKLSGGSDTIASLGYGTLGTKMYVNKTTGKADKNLGSAFTYITDAVYVKSYATGIDESGAEVACVVVDMVGGL